MTTATTTIPTAADLDAYIAGLNLSHSGYQVFDIGVTDGKAWTVLALYDGAGYELQVIIELDEHGTARWIPTRIFASEGRDAAFRGRCEWFNPEEIEESAIQAHNASVEARG